MTGGEVGGRVTGAVRWVPRLVASVLGAVLGMAVGHGLAWSTAVPLPDDAEARQIAAEFLPGFAGGVDRHEGWTFSPSGAVGTVAGFSEAQPPRVVVRFVADGATVQRPHLEAVGERLRASGWDRVWVDPDYPIVTGHYQGLDVRFGQAWPEPSSAGPGEAVGPRVVGVNVTIRQDTPSGAVLGLLAGALFGAVLGLAAAAGVQRLLQGTGSGVRVAVVVLSVAGAVGLAPGTLASLGGLYLLATEDLPHEPLWFAYSLMLPPTRLFAAAGLLSLTAAGAIAVGGRLRRPSPAA